MSQSRTSPNRPKRAITIRKKIKTLVFYAAFLGLSTTVCVAIAEGLLRLFPGVLPEAVQLRIHWQAVGKQKLKSIAHPYIGFLYPPNSNGILQRDDFKFHFNTDNYGFRNPKTWPPRADIVVVGDSLAFGYGVDDEQSWTSLLERKLGTLTVINLALIGSGPQQYQRVYETFGADLEPKLLIVGFFPDNDLRDAEKFARWTQLGAKGNYDAFRLFGQYEFSLRRGLIAIIRTSYFFTLLREARSSLRDRHMLQGRTVTLADGSEIQLVSSRFHLQKRLMQQDNLGLRLTIEAFRNLKKLTAPKSAELLILIFPSKEATYLPIFSDEPRDILGRFKQKLAKLGIDYLDLTPFFQERAAKGEMLFYTVDGHPNQRGYQLVADVVLAKLKDEGQKYGLRR